MKSVDSSLAPLALALTPGIGSGRYRLLTEMFGGPAEVFEAIQDPHFQPGRLGTKALEALRNGKGFRLAKEALENAEKWGAQVVIQGDLLYPALLEDLSDAPPVLFAKGDLRVLADRPLGIVGTRDASAYGKATIAQLIDELIPYQPTIVSGLALGIDAAAHRAAIAAGLPTVGVVATGLDEVYPAEHEQLAEQIIAEGGLILSEQPFHTPPRQTAFPARNRIIAGVSQAIVVVESKKKGGGLITADIATSYGREVFAVPGRLNDPRSEGCNNLIARRKAIALVSSRQLSKDLLWTRRIEPTTPPRESLLPDGIPEAYKHPEPAPEQKVEKKPLRDEWKPIADALEKAGKLNLESLSIRLGQPPHALAPLLLEMELEGALRMVPGGVYRLC